MDWKPIESAPKDAAEWPAATCCMGDDGCICPPAERALRGWSRGEITAAMTAEQREYCLSEIGRVEGYSRTDYEGCDDQELAHGTLNARGSTMSVTWGWLPERLPLPEPPDQREER